MAKYVEGAEPIRKGDPFWNTLTNIVVTVIMRTCETSKEQDSWKNELRQQLHIGDIGDGRDQDKLLLEILLERNEAFVPNDSELGETNVV